MEASKVNKLEMINLYNSGDYTQQDLANMYKVHRSRINAIIKLKLTKDEREVIKAKIIYRRGLIKLGKDYNKSIKKTKKNKNK